MAASLTSFNLTSKHSPKPLPALKLPTRHRSKEKKKIKSVRLATDSQNELYSPSSVRQSAESIFSDHCLVDSPRRILLEKTTLGMETVLSSHLDRFYANTAEIAEELKTKAVFEVQDLMEYIMPRLKKLGRKDGFKIKKAVFCGSTFDDTQVIEIVKSDVLIEIEKDKSTQQMKGHGYKYLPLRKYKEVEGGKPDVFRFGRSLDGSYLSSMIVTQNVYNLVERSLKLHPSAVMTDFCQEEGKAKIEVMLNEFYHIRLIPAIYNESDDSYLVTCPYDYDENPSSDCLWRIYNVNKERSIMTLMNSADRGARCQAFKLLKALVRAEPTLHGIPSYHVKTVLLHTFDDTVDHMPRWQRTSLEACFQRLLRDLLHYYSDRCLPNFFLHNYNLLEHMPQRTVSKLESRLSFLVSNQRELLRVLKKRSMVHGNPYM